MAGLSDRGDVRVLVYGTLKSSGTNYALMEKIRARFVGYDEIVSKDIQFRDLGPFPAVSDATFTVNHNVRGEVYAMNEEALAHLDFYEGHPNFFVRRKMWTEIQKVRAWVYFLGVPELKLPRASNSLPDGIWEPSEEEVQFWRGYDA